MSESNGGITGIGQYYSTEDKFEQIHTSLKNTMCPHCFKTGFLILHGYLYGYGETNLVRRGHRIFCSNRNNRNGCGKTFSMLNSWFIKNFTICACFLSAFLKKIKKGLSTARAFIETGVKMNRTSSYRILKRFRCNQPRIRTLLTRIKDPPDLSGIKDPVLQTIAHLKAVFKGCMVSQFQHYFQTSFL